MREDRCERFSRRCSRRCFLLHMFKEGCWFGRDLGVIVQERHALLWRQGDRVCRDGLEDDFGERVLLDIREVDEQGVRLLLLRLLWCYLPLRPLVCQKPGSYPLRKFASG